MIVIHYPRAFKALDDFIGSFNLQAEKQTEKIRAGAILTARELLRIYGISLLKASSLKGFDYKNLPALQTNNIQLARLVKCSPRSIQRYILKLRKAGIITAKKFRGSNASYELWFKEEILQVREPAISQNSKQNLQEALELAKKKEQSAHPPSDKMPGCPHTYSSNTRNIKNNLIIAVQTVENLPEAENSGNISGNTRKIAEAGCVSGDKEGSAAAAPPSDDARKIASRADQSGIALAQDPDPARDNFQRMYVQLFWMMARNLLYKNTDLTDSQVSIAQKLILNFYSPVKKEHMDKVHRIYIERISLVAKYLKRDPEKRFVPLPYIYFNTSNPKGFTGTKAWYDVHQKRKKEVALELALSRAIRKFTSNETKEPVKRKPPLKLFRECENTLGKLGDPSLVERFHAAVLEHQTFKKINHNTTLNL